MGPILLLQTCATDVLITRKLLLRISELNGWNYFDSLFIHLDNDIDDDEYHSVLRPAVPLPEEKIHYLRSDVFDAWRNDNVLSALRLYKHLSGYNADFVKMDSDIFPANEFFFRNLSRFRSAGFAGRVMPFFLEASMFNSPFRFIQGGVVQFGPEARSFIKTIDEAKVRDITGDVWRYVAIPDAYNKSDYEYFLTKVEDVVIYGILARIYDVALENIPGVQVSPYDIVTDIRDAQILPDEYAEKFIKSGALSYHYEGSLWQSRISMNKRLKWLYSNWSSLNGCQPPRVLPRSMEGSPSPHTPFGSIPEASKNKKD